MSASAAVEFEATLSPTTCHPIQSNGGLSGTPPALAHDVRADQDAAHYRRRAGDLLGKQQRINQRGPGGMGSRIPHFHGAVFGIDTAEVAPALVEILMTVDAVLIANDAVRAEPCDRPPNMAFVNRDIDAAPDPPANPAGDDSADHQKWQ